MVPQRVQARESHYGLTDDDRNRPSDMVYLKVDPTFDTLPDDPRFRALLTKTNFPMWVCDASVLWH
jgi:hypothetical protein